jgi:hypothetical protein
VVTITTDFDTIDASWIESPAAMGYSDLFKVCLLVSLGSFIPVTIAAFLIVRRTKRKAEFDRIIQILDVTTTEGDFARDRVAEQYAGNNYVLPVSFAWIISVIGFFALLYGADLVSEHVGKRNFLLTGLLTGPPEVLQNQRYQSMLMLCMAFVGAFLWSIQNMLRRLNAGDLTPAVYLSAGIRMTLAPVLSLVVCNVLPVDSNGQSSSNILVATAFLIGFFPDAAMQFLQEKVVHLFGATARKFSGCNGASNDLPLSMIEGIDVFDRARLGEIGIQNAQNLACANFILLAVRTSFGPLQLIDWIEVDPIGWTGIGVT